eukprot:477263-Prymnesium_polylepis.1
MHTDRSSTARCGWSTTSASPSRERKRGTMQGALTVSTATWRTRATATKGPPHWGTLRMDVTIQPLLSTSCTIDSAPSRHTGCSDRLEAPLTPTCAARPCIEATCACGVRLLCALAVCACCVRLLRALAACACCVRRCCVRLLCALAACACCVRLLRALAACACCVRLLCALAVCACCVRLRLLCALAVCACCVRLLRALAVCACCERRLALVRTTRAHASSRRRTMATGYLCTVGATATTNSITACQQKTARGQATPSPRKLAARARSRARPKCTRCGRPLTRSSPSRASVRCRPLHATSRRCACGIQSLERRLSRQDREKFRTVTGAGFHTGFAERSDRRPASQLQRAHRPANARLSPHELPETWD